MTTSIALAVLLAASVASPASAYVEWPKPSDQTEWGILEPGVITSLTVRGGTEVAYQTIIRCSKDRKLTISLSDDLRWAEYGIKLSITSQIDDKSVDVVFMPGEYTVEDRWSTFEAPKELRNAIRGAVRPQGGFLTDSFSVYVYTKVPPGHGRGHTIGYSGGDGQLHNTREEIRQEIKGCL